VQRAWQRRAGSWLGVTDRERRVPASTSARVPGVEGRRGRPSCDWAAVGGARGCGGLLRRAGAGAGAGAGAAT
jgi:hypothetical protein